MHCSTSQYFRNNHLGILVQSANVLIKLGYQEDRSSRPSAPRKTQVKLKNLDRFQKWEVKCIAPHLNISQTITWVYWFRLPMSRSNSATKETDLRDRVLLGKRKSNSKILTDSSSGKSYALPHISIFSKQSLGYTCVGCQCPYQTRLLGRPMFATQWPKENAS